MIRFSLYLLLLLPLYTKAQEYALFDTSTINNRSKLLGLYRTPQAYERLDFLIDNPDDIKALIPTFTSGTEVYPQLARDFFTITLLQDGKEIKVWTIDKRRNCLLFEGRSYLFDASILKKLAKENPFKVREVNMTFKSQEEADSYLDKQKLDRSFLFARMPTFDFEGQFDVRIPRQGIAPRSRVVRDTMHNTLSRLAPPGSFEAVLLYNRIAAADKKHYTFTVYCKKETYDQFDIAGWKKGKWIAAEARATLYYRKF